MSEDEIDHCIPVGISSNTKWASRTHDIAEGGDLQVLRGSVLTMGLDRARRKQCAWGIGLDAAGEEQEVRAT